MGARQPPTMDTAVSHLVDCHLCPHHCGIRRATAQGHCRIGQQAFIASEMLHVGEELPLRPAHAIFFSGCTATCSFCTAAKFAFHPTYGITVTPQQLAMRIRQRQSQGARSLCFIGGEPTPHIPFILQTLAALGEDLAIPAVFNSNFYLTDSALNLLGDAIDIYLPDLKFGPPSSMKNCGEQIGGMPNYWHVVTSAIETVWRRGGSLIVRHLLMPGHFDCCTRPVLHWLSQHPGITVSLLTQFLAPAHARGKLAVPLQEEEIAQARLLAYQLHLDLVE